MADIPETKRIASQLRRSYEGQAWHGPALKEILNGVTAEMALAKPIGDAHSIWELVLHVEAWAGVGVAALEGKPYDRLSGDRDWPPVQATTAEAWQAALQRLESTIGKLVTAVRAFEDAKLNELVAGSEFNYYFLLHGIAQHNLYHAGQIALLKKCGAGLRPAH